MAFRTAADLVQTERRIYLMVVDVTYDRCLGVIGMIVVLYENDTTVECDRTRKDLAYKPL